jgi:hypothetical protein
VEHARVRHLIRWTPEEDAILAEMFPSEPMDEIIERIGRTRDGVKRRAQTLGLRRSALRAGCWTPAEDKILADCYWDASKKEILERLPGRSWYAISTHAARVGVQRKHVHAGREKSKRSTDQRVMDFIIGYDRKFGFGPTRIEVSEATGMAHSTADGSVKRLIARGLLIRHPGRSRAVGLAPAVRRRLLERELAYREQVKAA